MGDPDLQEEPVEPTPTTIEAIMAGLSPQHRAQMAHMAANSWMAGMFTNWIEGLPGAVVEGVDPADDGAILIQFRMQTMREGIKDMNGRWHIRLERGL